MNINGDVAVNGTVPSYPQYLEAAAAAQRVAGVRNVHNHLQVVLPDKDDPDKEAKLDRIEHATSTFPDRCFAFDQFGPLSIRPCHGASWAPCTKPPAAGDLSPHPWHPLLPRLLLPSAMTSYGV